ncbi:MAG: hypothetical protein GY906_23840 [bacterium]|nr:hypothetical protein [bacterium]
MPEVEKRADGWWIAGLQDVLDCGPYSTKAEAESDRRGIERFLKYENRKGFMSVDSKPER